VTAWRTTSIVKKGSIIRFGIYWVDLNPPGKGHEQHKHRPCVTVSPEAMHQTGMAVICPMTTRIRQWPFRICVNCNGKPNQIMVDQIRAVSLERFDAFIEVLNPNDVQRLKDLIFKMYAL
jgi:mRNA interferase MazF